MKKNREDRRIYRIWRNLQYWLWNTTKKTSIEIFKIEREKRKNYHKNLHNPFPKGPKSPRVYKFYWSGY